MTPAPHPAREAPYGEWSSPLDAARVAAAAAPLGDAAFDGDAVLWSQPRPAERGRTTLYRRGPHGDVREITPAPFDVRTSVHEYGGGAWTVRDGVIVFVHHADQRLYGIWPGEEPRPLTPASEGRLRYADLAWTPDGTAVLAVREDHRPSDHEPVNALVSVPVSSGPEEGSVLVEGCDFYASPTPSPDGRHLAWIEWDHPNMPWDATRLRMADLNGTGRPGTAQRVAGGPDEAVQQPRFLPGGSLAFVSDRSGWWNLYLHHAREVRALWPCEEEFGQPAFALGLALMDVAGDDHVVATFGLGRPSRLAVVPAFGGEARELDLPYRTLSGVRAAPDGRTALMVAGAPTRPDALVRVDLNTGAHEELATGGPLPAGAAFLSEPETLTFSSTEGRAVHAHLYRPANPDHRAPDGTRPPLLVNAHGGPTSSARLGLDLKIHYWTSRGFAYLDVDYGGSGGYGRAFRRALEGRWGEVDVDDCTAAARALVARGEVDPDRLAVRGGSAGGYTTLAALAFRDVFHAGVSYYGVSDLEMLAKETHKFESRYFERLVGPYPEARPRYLARSPLHHALRIERPVLFLQGDEDKVVPPNQAELMVDALRTAGVPVAYLAFEGEAHGFRRADTIRAALEAEASFYAQVFGLEPADTVASLRVNGL